MEKRNLIKSNIKKYSKEFNAEIIKMFKEFFNKKTNKKQRANMLTFSRIIIPLINTILIIISIFTCTSALIISASVLTAIGGLSDFFDGKCARKYNSYSEFGQRLDQVSDKWFAFISLLDLSIINPIFINLLLFEGVIAGINLNFKLNNPSYDMKSSIIGKIKQWPLFTTMFIGLIGSLTSKFALTIKILCIITSIFQITTITDYKNKQKLIKKQLEINKNKLEIDNIDDYNCKELKSNKKIEEYTKLRNLLLQIKENNTQEVLVKDKQKMIKFK